MNDTKLDLTPLIEAGEPVIAIIISKNGLERSLLFYEEDNLKALEEATRLLGRVTANLMLLDNSLREPEPRSGAIT